MQLGEKCMFFGGDAWSTGDFTVDAEEVTAMPLE